MSTEISLTRHHTPRGFSDYFALAITKLARSFADMFFARRYGNRAIVLETVAAVPGMVGGVLQHLRALRRMESDKGWIHTLLDEAENERMHLMTFINIAQPTSLGAPDNSVGSGYFLQRLLSALFIIAKNCSPCRGLFRRGSSP